MIEDIIRTNTAALEANTAAVLENSGLLREAIELAKSQREMAAPVTRVAIETAAPSKPRGKKATEQRTDENGKSNHDALEDVVEKLKAAEEAPVTEEPVVEETPAAEVEPVTEEQEDRLINDEEASVIRAAYRDGSKATSDVNAHKEGFTALRKEFGVENVTKLMLSQYEEFLTRTKAL